MTSQRLTWTWYTGGGGLEEEGKEVGEGERVAGEVSRSPEQGQGRPAGELKANGGGSAADWMRSD